jgi:hypothetical protein
MDPVRRQLRLSHEASLHRDRLLLVKHARFVERPDRSLLPLLQIDQPAETASAHQANP